MASSKKLKRYTVFRQCRIYHMAKLQRAIGPALLWVPNAWMENLFFGLHLHMAEKYSEFWEDLFLFWGGGFRYIWQKSAVKIP